MLLHIDGSRHQWFQDERWYDLIVILDDATSEIYYAQLVEEESTVTVMAGLREVIERKGVFCALYSDRGSHFWLTPKVGAKVDYHRRTQVGRALHELGVQMIPAYSPQARGRSERSFSTWQGRLPQELRLHQIASLEAANVFLREHYMAEFNRRFQVAAAQRGSAFLPRRGRDLNSIFSLQFERTVNRDNTFLRSLGGVQESPAHGDNISTVYVMHQRSYRDPPIRLVTLSSRFDQSKCTRTPTLPLPCPGSVAFELVGERQAPVCCGL
jgi:hypothetical protein